MSGSHKWRRRCRSDYKLVWLVIEDLFGDILFKNTKRRNPTKADVTVTEMVRVSCWLGCREPVTVPSVLFAHCRVSPAAEAHRAAASAYAADHIQCDDVESAVSSAAGTGHDTVQFDSTRWAQVVQ